MESLPSWSNGTLGESLSNDSVMILFNNETSLSAELPSNHDLSAQSMFISNSNNLKSELLNSNQSLENIALNAFQLDSNGQLIPVYTSDLEDENRLLFENENLDSNLLLLKNNTDSLKNLLVNDIIITVPFGESKLPDFLNLQLKSKDLPSIQQPPSSSEDSSEYVEERLKVFHNILVENKKKRIIRPRVENPSADPQYTCEFCSMQFEKSHQYYGHLHVHSGEQTWDCQKCKSSFMTQYQLRRHERRYHLDYRPHICSICNETFERQSQLDYHRRRVHENEKSFKCQICSKAFFKGSDLKTHVNIHLKVNGCVCETCGRRFSHVSNLIRHKRVHSGIRPYLCGACGRRFSQVTTLNEHMFSSCRGATKPIECSHCSQPFAPQLMRKHLHDAHGIKEKKNKPVVEKRKYYCKICGDRFPFINALKKHEHDVHSSEKNLSCSKCKKEMASLDLLLKHCCEKKSKSRAATKEVKKKNKLGSSKNASKSKTETTKFSLNSTVDKFNSDLQMMTDSLVKDSHTVMDLTNVENDGGENYSQSTDIISSRIPISIEKSDNVLKCPIDSSDALSSRNDNTLDLNVEMIDVGLKQAQNLQVLENSVFLKDIDANTSDNTGKVQTSEAVIDPLEIPTANASDCFMVGDGQFTDKMINGNYVTIDLDFSINGILNGPSDLPTYSKMPISDKNLPPLVSLCDRFDKDMFDNDASSCENTLIKLVDSESCLDYKSLLSDARALILDANQHKLPDSLQFSGENLSSSLLRSVLMVDSSAGNANLILSDVNYDTSHNLNFSQCDKLDKVAECQETSKNLLYLPQSMSDLNTAIDSNILDSHKNGELGDSLHDINSEENLLLLNQYLILPSKNYSKPSNQPVYICSHCDKVFLKLQDLNEHAEILNRSDCKYQCGVCAQKFALKTSLDQHESTHSSDQSEVSKKVMLPGKNNAKTTIFTCSYCNKTFNKLKSLNQHAGIHNVNRCKYHCDVCGQKFAWKTSFSRHVAAHRTTGQPKFSCAMCAKVYVTVTRLQEHVKRDHYHQRPHICKICAKCFFKKSDLKAHTRTHTQEKPYMCGTCAKSFRHVSHLIRHERTHLGIKPYKCMHCTGSFSQMGVLKNHMRIKHPDEKIEKT